MPGLEKELPPVSLARFNFQPATAWGLCEELCWAFSEIVMPLLLLHTRTAKLPGVILPRRSPGAGGSNSAEAEICMRPSDPVPSFSPFSLSNVFHDRILVRRIFMNNSKVPIAVEANA